MEMKYPQKTVALARGILFILMAAIAAAAVTLPIWLREFLLYKNCYDTARFILLATLLILSAAFALLLLWQGNGFLKSVGEREPFVQENVTRLKRVSLFSVAIAAIYVLAACVYLSVFMCVFIGTFSVVAVMAWIMSALFAQAVAFKQENELTI